MFPDSAGLGRAEHRRRGAGADPRRAARATRVTIHPRVIAAARRVLVVTTGASKAGKLAHAWTGDDVRELPIRAARIPNATWILDEAAAAELPRD